jgi:hypothetical protein
MEKENSTFRPQRAYLGYVAIRTHQQVNRVIDRRLYLQAKVM